MVAYGIVEPIFRMLKIDAMLLRTGLDSRLRPLTFSHSTAISSPGQGKRLNPKDAFKF